MTVHLVNLTNPMMLKGPARDAFPIAGQRVRVRLPDGWPARSVRLLSAGSTPVFRQANGWLEVEVPSFGVHEVVAIDA
jgi:hypothetical protein